MALTSPGAATGIVRGKIGSSVFTKGVSGPTIRVRVKPRNPRSTAQTAARANLAAGSRAFKSLTSGNLANWRTYALTVTRHNRVTGTAYSPAPLNAFNQLFNGFITMTPTGTFSTTPPTAPYVPTAITITAAGSSGTITFTGSAAQSGPEKTFFLIQKLKSSARKPNPKGYINAKVAAIPGTPFQVSVASLPVGTYAVGYKFGATMTGQTSLPVFLGNVIVS